MSFIKLKNWINENASEDITVLYPGGFKPTTGGHLDLIKRYSQHPSVKEIKVLVGPGIRNGIDQDLAAEIAINLTSRMPKVTIEKSKYPSPILTAYKTIENAKPGNYALGSSSKGDDYKRVRDFTDQHQPGGKYFDKVPEGVKVVELAIDAEPAVFQNRKGDQNNEPISASILRRDVLDGDQYSFGSGYPDSSPKEIDKVWNLLQGKLLESNESLTNKLFEFAMPEYGKLEKFETEEDLVYYVDYNFGKAMLTNEFVDEIGEEFLDELLGQSVKWWIIEYNPSKTAHRDSKYRIVGIDEDEDSVYENLNESVVSKVNKHMTHAEDLVVLSGLEGLTWVTDMFLDLYGELKGSTPKGDMKLSVKIDGAPAIFAWSKFKNLPAHGIAMKGLFAKTPKVFTTVEEIEENFGDRPDLAYKLKTFLKHLPNIDIPKEEIWQGDFLFDDKSVSETTIDGEDFYAFHPNTIYYVVPKQSDLGKLMAKAEVGITWHTRYTGPDLSSVSANYNAAASELSMVDSVLMTDPYIKSFAGIANFTEEENTRVEKGLNELSDIGNELKQGGEYAEIVNNKDIIAIFSIFQNSLIKVNRKIIDPGKFLNEFISFIQERGVKAADKLKSEKGKEKAMIKFAGYIDDIQERKDIWYIIIHMITEITWMKELFIKKLNNIGSFQTYLKMKEGNLRSTNQEGFAVSDINGNVVKLVSREEFSFANFSPDVAKGWMPK